MKTIMLDIGNSRDTAVAMGIFRDRLGETLEPDLDALAIEVEAALVGFERSGNELAAIGARLDARRVIELPCCRVLIVASYGPPVGNGLWAWFRSAFRRT